MSQAEKALAHAEQELAKSPAHRADFHYGDEGIGAYLVTCGVLFGVLCTIVGLVVVGFFTGPVIFVVVGISSFVVGNIWMIVLAFTKHVAHGLGCLFFPPYTLVFAFLNFQHAKIPLMLEVLGIATFVASFFIPFGSGDEQQRSQLLQMLGVQLANLVFGGV
jgi:hypothetical protein